MALGELSASRMHSRSAVAISPARAPPAPACRLLPPWPLRILKALGPPPKSKFPHFPLVKSQRSLTFPRFVMPKARASVSRVVVASPALRDGAAPAPSTDPFRPPTGRASERVSPRVSAPGSSGSSNVRSSPRSRVPLGNREPATFSPTSGAPASTSAKKSSRARYSSPPPQASAADLSAALTAPAAIAPPFVFPATSAPGMQHSSLRDAVGRSPVPPLAFPATVANPPAIASAPTPYRDALLSQPPFSLASGIFRVPNSFPAPRPSTSQPEAANVPVGASTAGPSSAGLTSTPSVGISDLPLAVHPRLATSTPVAAAAPQHTALSQPAVDRGLASIVPGSSVAAVPHRGSSNFPNSPLPDAAPSSSLVADLSCPAGSAPLPADPISVAAASGLLVAEPATAPPSDTPRSTRFLSTLPTDAVARHPLDADRLHPAHSSPSSAALLDAPPRAAASQPDADPSSRATTPLPPFLARAAGSAGAIVAPRSSAPPAPSAPTSLPSFLTALNAPPGSFAPRIPVWSPFADPARSSARAPPSAGNSFSLAGPPFPTTASNVHHSPLAPRALLDPALTSRAGLFLASSFAASPYTNAEHPSRHDASSGAAGVSNLPVNVPHHSALAPTTADPPVSAVTAPRSAAVDAMTSLSGLNEAERQRAFLSPDANAFRPRLNTSAALLPEEWASTPIRWSALQPHLSAATISEHDVYAARANFDAAPFTPPLLINGSNSTLSTSAREGSALLPLSDPPAPPTSAPSFANAVRFQLSQSRQQGFPPPAQHPGSGGGSGRELELGGAPPRQQLSVRPLADPPGRNLADPSARLARPLADPPLECPG